MEELQDRLNNFDTHLRTIEGKKSRQLELKQKETETLDDLRKKERTLATEHGGLIAQRRVRLHLMSLNTEPM